MEPKLTPMQLFIESTDAIRATNIIAGELTKKSCSKDSLDHGGQASVVERHSLLGLLLNAKLNFVGSANFASVSHFDLFFEQLQLMPSIALDNHSFTITVKETEHEPLRLLYLDPKWSCLMQCYLMSFLLHQLDRCIFFMSQIIAIGRALAASAVYFYLKMANYWFISCQKLLESKNHKLPYFHTLSHRYFLLDYDLDKITEEEKMKLLEHHWAMFLEGDQLIGLELQDDDH